MTASAAILPCGELVKKRRRHSIRGIYIADLDDSTTANQP
jgi:hypothetical protein